MNNDTGGRSTEEEGLKSASEYAKFVVPRIVRPAILSPIGRGENKLQALPSLRKSPKIFCERPPANFEIGPQSKNVMCVRGSIRV